MGTLSVFASVAVILAMPLYPGDEHSGESSGRYQIDSTHATTIFRIKHLNVSYFYGRFKDTSGSFTIDDSDASKCSFDLQVKAESIDTNFDGRDRHLRSPDFFNVKQYPTLAFKSTSVNKSAPDTYEVTGKLTLHGVTKELTVKLEHSGAGRGMESEFRCGFETVFVIKRSEFGMDFMLDKLSDEVRVIVSFEGVRQ